jgi:hypothetical protein
MRKMNFLAVLIMAAVIVMCGCSKPENETGQPEEPQKLVLTARIATPSQSRAVISEGADGVLKTTWRQGDVLRIVNPASGTDAIFEIDEISSDGMTATFTGEISAKGGVLYAVSSTNGTGYPGYVDGIYCLQAPDLGYYYTQDGSGNVSNMNNFAILYGSFSFENPTIVFRHTMAFFKLTLTLPDGETIPDGSSASIALDIPTSRYPFMNLATGEWLANNNPSGSGILRVMVNNLDSGDTEIVGYMAVFPSDVGGREIALTLEINDGNGNAETYTKMLTAKTPRLIESGKYYTITEQFSIPSLEDAEGGSIVTMTPEEF